MDQGLISSDHNCIKFKLTIDNIEPSRQLTKKQEHTKKVNWLEFREEINNQYDQNKITTSKISIINNKKDLEDIINKYINIIIQASDLKIPKY